MIKYFLFKLISINNKFEYILYKITSIEFDIIAIDSLTPNIAFGNTIRYNQEEPIDLLKTLNTYAEKIQVLESENTKLNKKIEEIQETLNDLMNLIRDF